MLIEFKKLTNINDLDTYIIEIQKVLEGRIQADSILELKLRRLTGLERAKIEEELSNLLSFIEELRGILADEQKAKDNFNCLCYTCHISRCFLLFCLQS